MTTFMLANNAVSHAQGNVNQSKPVFWLRPMLLALAVAGLSACSINPVPIDGY